MIRRFHRFSRGSKVPLCDFDVAPWSVIEVTRTGLEPFVGRGIGDKHPDEFHMEHVYFWIN